MTVDLRELQAAADTYPGNHFMRQGPARAAVSLWPLLPPQMALALLRDGLRGDPWSPEIRETIGRLQAAP